MPLRAARRLLSRAPSSPGEGLLVKKRLGGQEALRLSWVWTTASHPDANLGDALSAVVVGAIARRPIVRASFGAKSERLAAVGTIGHALHRGKVHLWGTGFDMERDRTGATTGYQPPENTEIVVHAVRGRKTAEALRRRGVDVPESYGDPVWFLPKIFPEIQPKCYDLGVIVHISELEKPTANALVRAAIKRYRIPEHLADQVHIINTYAPATIEGLREKVDEIVSCRRILSTSLHGLVIAEAYGIPCAWFATYPGEPGEILIDGNQPIDHRMKDFYSGVGRNYVLSYLQPLNLETDWAETIRFLDNSWKPVEYDGKALFDAFPLEKQVPFHAATWPDETGALAQIPL
jgi:hypothetical protein